MEKRQINMRAWVTGGVCSPLPVPNDLCIQNTTKVTGHSGLPSSINVHRCVYHKFRTHAIL